MTFTGRPRLMLSTSGRNRAMVAWTTPLPRATFLLMSLGMKISTNTEAGKRLLITAPFGFRRLCRVGHLITTATGFGKTRGDGPGLKLSLGATLPSTMAVGCMAAATGDGLQDRFGC